MIIEKNYYVVMKPGQIDIGDETLFVSGKSENGFTNDILLADKCGNRKTALSVKQDYDLRENKGYESNMQIVPLKVTYEW